MKTNPDTSRMKLIENQAAIAMTDRGTIAVAIDTNGAVSFYDVHGKEPGHLTQYDLKTGLRPLSVAARFTYGDLAILGQDQVVHVYEWRKADQEKAGCDWPGRWVKGKVARSVQSRAVGIHFTGITICQQHWFGSYQISLANSDDTRPIKPVYSASWWQFWDYYSLEWR
jgi:hypothetical protein